MQFERLYADDKGETHFEQVKPDMSEADYRPPAPLMYVSHAYPSSAFQFVRLPSGWVGEGISPPEKQFFVCLQGEVEITSSTGAKRTIKPGEAVLMEDTDGNGHTTRVKGKECFAAVVTLPNE